MGMAGGMIIFLEMVNMISMIIRRKIKGLRAELARQGRIWACAALPARGGPALMTWCAEY
jgi:hypothetical protein